VSDTAVSLQPVGKGRVQTPLRRVLLAAVAVAMVAAIVAGGAAASWWWLRPPPADRRLEEALADVSRHDFAAAREKLASLRASGQEAEALFLRGSMLLEKGYLYPALDDLKQASQQPRLRLPALAMMGQAWYRLGLHVEAQSALHEVLRDEPDSVDAHRWLAASCYDLGAIHDALGHLERTAELDPSDPRPHRLLGLIHKDYERYAEAIGLYEESLRRRSDQPDANEIREELAACQVKLLRHQDALKTLAGLPDSAAAQVLRGECYHALGQLDRARGAVASALEHDPDYLEAVLMHGTLLLEDGRAEEAIAVFERAAALRPRDYTAHFKLAQAFAQAGNEESAQSAQEQAEEIRQIRLEFAKLHQEAWDRPRDGAVRLRLAELAHHLGRPDLADVWMKSAAALRFATP
jgi:tetratricopeptide (TPR) repeat protein